MEESSSRRELFCLDCVVSRARVGRRGERRRRRTVRDRRRLTFCLVYYEMVLAWSCSTLLRHQVLKRVCKVCNIL